MFYSLNYIKALKITLINIVKKCKIEFTIIHRTVIENVQELFYHEMNELFVETIFFLCLKKYALPLQIFFYNKKTILIN